LKLFNQQAFETPGCELDIGGQKFSFEALPQNCKHFPDLYPEAPGIPINGKEFSMGVINSAIFAILERFPDSKDAIKHLFSANGDFRILCEDFRQCSQALAYWNQSTNADATARRQEYEVLQRELEDEINQILDEAESKADP
jgi:hypothetical protein